MTNFQQIFNSPIFKHWSSSIENWDLGLTKIESGVIKKPSVIVMAKIAKALNVSIENLIK
jgi:transcriptional regulator with XRE-family HTH domain